MVSTVHMEALRSNGLEKSIIRKYAEGDWRNHRFVTAYLKLTLTDQINSRRALTLKHVG